MPLSTEHRPFSFIAGLKRTKWACGMTVEERFWFHTDQLGPEPRTGSIAQRQGLGRCWQWDLKPDSKGYGRLTVNKTHVQAHRLSYELAGNTLREGMELDHLCRHTMCVNPAHLEQVDHSVNMLRSEKCYKTRTHCKRGHLLSPDNLYTFGTGQRTCKSCVRLRYQRGRR